MFKNFIKRAKEVHGELYDYSLVPNSYSNNRTPTKIICSTHGIFGQRPDNHLSGKGCKKCVRTSTTEEFIQKSIKTHGSKYDYSHSEFINAITKLKIICKKHDVFEQLPSKHISGDGCPKCAGNTKQNITDLVIVFNKIHSNKYDYSLSVFINNKTKMKIICKTHGIFEQSSDNHKAGHGCNKCHIDKIKITKEQFIHDANLIHGGKYNYSLSDYTITDEKINIYCQYHGWFSQKPVSHKAGRGCEICSRFVNPHIFSFLNNKGWLYNQHVVLKKTLTQIAKELGCDTSTVGNYFEKHNIIIERFYRSVAEIDICDFIRGLNISIEKSVRYIINPFELDIYLPERKIAIEFCGLYWHSEVYKDKNYHANKLKLCNEKGIRLLTIFEDEWEKNKNIIKSKIKSILHLDDRERVYARNTTIVVLNSNQKANFFKNNHIQGNGLGSITYGLRHKDCTVAVITFIKQNTGTYILTRYATSEHVIGGFSKLVEHFKKHNAWKYIIAFADLRWSDGNMYLKCGFEIDKNINVDYQYIDTNTISRINKFNYQHKRSKKKLKIWDCGKRKYICVNS